MLLASIIIFALFGVALSDLQLPLNCLTTDGRSCLLPFKHGGQDVNECIQVKAGKPEFYCPTALIEGSGEAKDWGECQPDSCVTACSTVTGERCVFPFKFDNSGSIQGRCASKDGKLVCPVTVDGERVGMKYDDCLMETCPLD